MTPVTEQTHLVSTPQSDSNGSPWLDPQYLEDAYYFHSNNYPGSVISRTGTGRI